MAWVIPAISGRPSYDFISRYAQLGGSYLEIFLSPILRPRVFFSTLFRPEVGFYLCLLLAPVIWLTALQPWALLAGSLVIAGVCLQQSRQSMILPLQYHSEYLAYVYVLAVFGAARLQHGPPVSGWVRRWWFLEKSEAGDSSRLVLVATFAVFAGSALGFLWFSLAPFSRNSLRFLPQAPPLAPHLAEFDRLIPPDTELTVSPFLASHYAFRNLVYYPSAKLCDWVLLDLGERIRYEAQRRQLLCSPDYQCLAVKSCGRSFLMLFARGKAERPPPPPVIAPEAWTDAGFGLPPGQWREPDIACRIRPERKMDGRLRLTIALRLERQFDHDFDLLLDQGGAAPDRKVVLLPFGNGLWPAYLLPPGATWSFTVDDLPPDAAVALQVRHKPPP